jgi:AtzE family amidohydrolase
VRGDPCAADASARAIAEAVRTRLVTASAITTSALDRIARGDAAINCFTTITAERALAEADAVDRKIASGEDPGPLAGVPYAVKDLFDIVGIATRAGSAIHAEAPPAERDAGLIERMGEAGAVLVGALNMDEYAYGFTTENSHYGATRNPHDPRRIAGGSSGGSAAAVAAGFVPLTLGSDTNGSIRVPSSLCGIFGLKPTYGRLGRGGSFPFVDSLDHLGPFARHAKDLAECYRALQGPDPRDAACVGDSAPLADLPATPRVAIAAGYFRDGASPEALAAIARVASALGATREIELPEPARARAAAYLITAAEGSNLHLPDLQARAADFDPATRDRFLAGALMPASWVVQAQRFRRWYRDRVLELFRQCDIILAPATPITAPLIGQPSFQFGGQEIPTRPNLGLFTQPISFIGLPVVVVPLPTATGMPIGVQLIAAPWCEDILLRAAAQLEERGIAQAPVAVPVEV